MRKRFGGFAAALCLSLLLCACPSFTMDGPDYGDDGVGTIEEGSTLFESLPESPGVYEFYTNDTKYAGGNGYTFWALNGAVGPFERTEATVLKYSGNAFAGFGIVAGHAENDGQETMLIVMINISREFIIGEVVGAQFKVIEPWTVSEHLRYGFNQENVIELSRDGASGDFSLKLNGQHVKTFKPDESPYHDHGRSGFIAVVSPQDKFPGTPVRIRYQEH